MIRGMHSVALLFWIACVGGAGGVVADASGADASSHESRKGPEVTASGGAATDGAAAEGSLPWRDQGQKVFCEALLPPLRSNLVKARDFSIHGDSCASAEHARLFRDDVEKAVKECPSGFLTLNGFTERAVRNVKTLYILGKKRCRQPEGSAR